MGMADQMPPRPGMTWKELPAGWSSRGAAGMRAANFTIEGGDQGAADLAVIPLPGTGGTDLDLVNLWRGQLGLAPIEASQLASHTDETSVGGQPVKLFRIVGTEDAQAPGATNQILVAALRRDGFTWFFKMAGPQALVSTQTEPLKGFLGQVEFTAASASAPAQPASSGTPTGTGRPQEAAPAADGQPQVAWDVPPEWEQVPPTQMIHSKWRVKAPSGEAADVTVSVFPGETGGMVANLNRWRSQVGLQPAPEAEITSLIDNMDVLGGKGTLVDFSGSGPENGDPLRLVGAVVRRGSQSWFYKLLGPEAAVAAHRDAFVKFVQSARYTRGS